MTSKKETSMENPIQISDYTGEYSAKFPLEFEKEQIIKFITEIDKHTSSRIEYIITNDLSTKRKYEVSMSSPIALYEYSSMTSIITKFLTGNYVFLLFLDHGLGILVKKCNIKHCEMIANSFNDNVEVVSQPDTILNTPIVDLSHYTNSMHSNRLISIFEKLVTDKYYIYDKDDVSVAFYRAIGFDVDKYMSFDVDAYASDDD